MFLRLKKRHTANNNYESFSDEMLVEQYHQTQNKDLVAVLFERYTHLVYGICLQYLPDHDQCKDAVMEIFESLFEKLAQYRIISFKNWLYSVARNHCLMMLRKSGSYAWSLKKAAEIGSSSQGHEETTEADPVYGTDALIHSAVEKLGDEQRLCVSLMYLEDKSYKDITRITGLSLKQVKSHIQNGKRNLKNFLLSRYDFIFR